MNDPILSLPHVIEALRQAWGDSEPDKVALRHEEGGYIMRRPDQSVSVERWPQGQQGRIVPPPLDAANCYNGEVVIAAFHTHPNPPIDENGDEWEQGPSASDKRWHVRRKLPGYVISRDVLYAIDAAGNVQDAGKREEVLA